MVLDRETSDTHPCEADFVAKVVEAANAVLGVFVVVVLDEAKAEAVLAPSMLCEVPGVRHTLCKDQCSSR